MSTENFENFEKYSKLKYVVYDYRDQKFHRLPYENSDTLFVYLKYNNTKVVIQKAHLIHESENFYVYGDSLLKFGGYSSWHHIKEGIAEAIKNQILPQFTEKFKEKYPDYFV